MEVVPIFMCTSLTSVLEIAPNPGRRSVSTVDTLLLSLVELLLYTLPRCPSHFSCQEAVDRPLVQSSSRPAPAFALSRIPQTYLQAKLYRNLNHGPSISVEARVMDSSTVLNLPVTCALSPPLYPSRSCTALTWHYRLSCPPSDWIHARVKEIYHWDVLHCREPAEGPDLTVPPAPWQVVLAPRDATH